MVREKKSSTADARPVRHTRSIEKRKIQLDLSFYDGSWGMYLDRPCSCFENVVSKTKPTLGGHLSSSPPSLNSLGWTRILGSTRTYSYHEINKNESSSCVIVRSILLLHLRRHHRHHVAILSYENIETIAGENCVPPTE
jgi:hypothetical protein